jgi:hypothetical protein
MCVGLPDTVPFPKMGSKLIPSSLSGYTFQTKIRESEYEFYGIVPGKEMGTQKKVQNRVWL